MHRNSEHELLTQSNMSYLSPVWATPLPEGTFHRPFFVSVSLPLSPAVGVIAFLFPKGCRVGALSLVAAWSLLEPKKEPFIHRFQN